jgi:glutamate dehydrogenase (NAD(P)+)
MEISELLPPQTLDSDPVVEFEADLEQAARAVDLEPWVLQRLKHAEREITLNLPLVRDDGTAVNITGYRIQHSRAHGPSIGPVTLSPTMHPALLRATAAEYTLQSALLGLRLGGAAGAIVVDPDQLSERELRHVVKDYGTVLHENSGPLRDVLACGTNEYIAAWLEEANTHARGQSEPAAVVGKANALLDPPWGHAMCAAIREVLHTDRIGGVRFAIQGFGRDGRALTEAVHAQGGIVVAVADRSGGVIRDDGIDVIALEKHVAKTGVLFGFTQAEAAGNSDVLECDCDVLVLAAAPRQIAGHNGRRIRAQVILELVNAAVTQSGETTLPESCLVVPHLIAGATRLAIWSHEWQRGLTYSAPEPQQAEGEACALVTHALDRARRLAEERQITLRNAALRLALSRLASTLRHR